MTSEKEILGRLEELVRCEGYDPRELLYAAVKTLMNLTPHSHYEVRKVRRIGNSYYVLTHFTSKYVIQLRIRDIEINMPLI